MVNKRNDIKPDMEEFLDEQLFVWDNLPDDLTTEELEDILCRKGRIYGKGWGRQ